MDVMKWRRPRYLDAGISRGQEKVCFVPSIADILTASSIGCLQLGLSTQTSSQANGRLLDKPP